MTSSSRDDLLRALDALELAALSGNSRRVERRARDARALVMLLVPRGQVCGCGVRCATTERFDEHVHLVHGGPTPEHWRRDSASDETAAGGGEGVR